MPPSDPRIHLVEAFEYNGQRYDTEAEAGQAALRDDLRHLAAGWVGCQDHALSSDGVEIVDGMVRNFESVISLLNRMGDLDRG